jgi:hypothetical protein
MTKTQEVIMNVLAIIIGYILPIVVLRGSVNNIDHVYAIQLVVLFIILVTGLFLIYRNNKNRRKYVDEKIWFIIFEVLGILGIFYTLIPFYLIFAFRNGINF